MSKEINEKIGDHLRRLRKQKGMSLLDVEATSSGEFKSSVLGAYERGERAISAPRLARLADLYGVSLPAMLPRYITGRRTVSDCIFCKIASGDIPSDLVYDGERVIAFRDINPQAPVHVQIIPRDHVASMDEFDAERDSGWLSEMFEAARKIAEQEGLDKGYRMVFNNGAQAGQSVLHVHLHVLGGRALSWPPG